MDLYFVYAIAPQGDVIGEKRVTDKEHYNEVSEMYRRNLHRIARDGNYEYPTPTEVFNIVFSVVVEAISEQMSVENGGIYAEWRDSGMVEVSYKRLLPRYQ